MTIAFGLMVSNIEALCFAGEFGYPPEPSLTRDIFARRPFTGVIAAKRWLQGPSTRDAQWDTVWAKMDATFLLHRKELEENCAAYKNDMIERVEGRSERSLADLEKLQRVKKGICEWGDAFQPLRKRFSLKALEKLTPERLWVAEKAIWRQALSSQREESDHYERMIRLDMASGAAGVPWVALKHAGMERKIDNEAAFKQWLETIANLPIEAVTDGLHGFIYHVESYHQSRANPPMSLGKIAREFHNRQYLAMENPDSRTIAMREGLRKDKQLKEIPGSTELKVAFDIEGDPGHCLIVAHNELVLSFEDTYKHDWESFSPAVVTPRCPASLLMERLKPLSSHQWTTKSASFVEKDDQAIILSIGALVREIMRKKDLLVDLDVERFGMDAEGNLKIFSKCGTAYFDFSLLQEFLKGCAKGNNLVLIHLLREGGLLDHKMTKDLNEGIKKDHLKLREESFEKIVSNYEITISLEELRKEVSEILRRIYSRSDAPGMVFPDLHRLVLDALFATYDFRYREESEIIAKVIGTPTDRTLQYMGVYNTLQMYSICSQVNNRMVR